MSMDESLTQFEDFLGHWEGPCRGDIENPDRMLFERIEIAHEGDNLVSYFQQALDDDGNVIFEWRGFALFEGADISITYLSPNGVVETGSGKMWLGEEGWLYGRVTTDVYSFADVESPETVERIMKLRGNELITDTDRLVSGGQLLQYHARMTRVDREDV